MDSKDKHMRTLDKVIFSIEETSHKKKHSLKEAFDDFTGITAKEIFFANHCWQFDFKKGLDALIKRDTSGEYIYSAGKEWKEFDFKKGLDAIVKVDRTGEWIYYAGVDWKWFDYEKGLSALKNTEYYKKALRDWPKNIKQIDKAIQDIKKSATPFKTGKLKLRGK